MNNPIRDEKRYYRVIRGGSWDDRTKDVRSSERVGYVPTYRDYDLGFRIARSKA